jgi:uncharacterized membrane protein YedE/YeeE
MGGDQLEHLLPDRLPWFIAGPLLGLLVAGLYAMANRPLGATGPYVQVIALMRGRVGVEVWRIWFLAGMLAGGALAALGRGGVGPGLGYGTLGQVLPLPALAIALLGAGLLIGFGARWAGGCTSGHGLSGNAILSPASLAATATFMGTAVAVTAFVHLVTGGAL